MRLAHGLCPVVLIAALAACGGDEQGSGSTGAGGGSVTIPCGEEPKRSGEATYYNEADGSGNCSFDPTPDDLMVGAMNHADYAESAACGACARVSGPNGEITIRIVDQCPECQPGDIDLSPVAFQEIAPLEAGRVKIDWQYVGCEVSGPVVYHFKEGSNPYWTAVQVRNHRNAIATIEARGGDGAYRALKRVDYNYFLEESGLGEGPYAFRVTDVHGAVIEDEGIVFVEAGDSPGKQQFPACL